MAPLGALSLTLLLLSFASPAGARASSRALRRRYGEGLALSGAPDPQSAPPNGDAAPVSAAALAAPDASTAAPAPGGAGAEPTVPAEEEVTWDMDADEAAVMAINARRPAMSLQLAKLITLQWCALVRAPPPFCFCARAAAAPLRLPSSREPTRRAPLPAPPPAAASRWAR